MTPPGGTWRIAGCRDYWRKYEHPWHTSPTANQHDASAANELALADHEEMFGRPLIDAGARDEAENVVPAVTVVTDNGGPFRSSGSGISSPPTPSGSRERGFQSLKYERLYLEKIDDVLSLVAHAEHHRTEYNTVRPHEAIAWNRPLEVHLGYADPTTPNFENTQILPAA
ncbi:hypothetical protein [Xylanimonas sp. McL0601]|uniref:hypothetical protein n=1 Tax=Xylanimonas sp. McL0601 TaxID=3414739 RepID=UPI003CF8CAF4